MFTRLSRPTTRFASTYITIRAMSTPSSTPVNLISVNTAPDRAKKVIGTVIENVKDKYNIIHAGNSTSKYQSEGKEGRLKAG